MVQKGGKSRLTHWYARKEANHSNSAKDTTHMPRPPFSSKVIYERAESVEQEVLNHHLQDEDLGRVVLEGVTKFASLARQSS